METQTLRHGFAEFELKERPITVAEYYGSIYATHISPRKSQINGIYLCGPINSALYRRVEPDNVMVALEENGKITEQVGSLIAMSLSEMEEALSATEGAQSEVHTPLYVTMPHRLKKHQLPESHGSWKESEFNLFWLLYISGLPMDYVKEFETLVYANIDRALFNDHHGNFEARLKLYKSVVDMFVDFVKTNNIQDQLLKVNALVTLPDSKFSVGSLYEQYLCEQIGVVMAEARFADHPDNEQLFSIYRGIQNNDKRAGRFQDAPFKIPLLDPGDEFYLSGNPGGPYTSVNFIIKHLP